ncbi:16S rRNA (guanine(527)-N(7))-methyltransferase RsmG [Gordonia sp. NPDC058843]|uniref:16S rRNA (guanine(527)-N(7))-methyltransferase RsmG n=1 Tax=Gordonia sp. NPDC058843 TaxID=3346648 RepID=UPI003684A0F9
MPSDAEPEHDHDLDALAVPPAAAADVFGERLSLAEDYWRILATDGIDHGLMGPREVPRLWDRHILNCGVLGELISNGQRVIDIGSGAGLPGVPLAVARPDLVITLVEPLLRRSTFLERTISALALDNVTVVRGRAEEKSVRTEVGPADVVTSRAVAPLERLAKWSAPLVRPGGRMIAIKGSSAAEEIERDRAVVGRSGIAELSVQTCGDRYLETPTTVIVGTKNERARSGRSGRR